MAGIGIKVSTSIASAGALGGGAYGIYAYNNTTDTLGNYLKKNNLTPRTTNWETVLVTYKLEKTSSTEIKDTNITKASEIETWCTTNLKKNIRSTQDSLFQQASNWCVSYQTIGERLGDNKQLEDSAETLDGKHASLPPDLKSWLSEVKLDTSPTQHKNGERLKKWCSENSKRRFDTSNSKFINYVTTHCTKPK